MRIERAMESSYYPVYGETLKIREIAGLVLSETRYRPRLSIPYHKHEEDAYFNLVLEGGYRERSGRSDREFVQSTSYSIPTERHIRTNSINIQRDSSISGSPPNASIACARRRRL